MEMLGSTDIRVATPDARFAVMEPKRGLFAGGGTTVRLLRQIAQSSPTGPTRHRCRNARSTSRGS
jgi:enoyl-CoA hydratase/carnithine racemase